MRPIHLLVVLAFVAALTAVVLTRPGRVRAEEAATLHVSGLDIGKGERAIVRLHNASGSSFVVHYTVFAHDTLFDSPVALSLPGAGEGARLFAGDTLELDIGRIVSDYRALIEAGEWDAPLRFVAFGTSAGSATFGPHSVVAEALQTRGRATYAADVTWIGD